MRLTFSIGSIAGLASAAVAAVQGQSVRLHLAAGSEPQLKAFAGQRQVPIDGYYGEHVAEFETNTEDLAAALEGADLLAVVGNAFDQRAAAAVAAERLGRDDLVLLAPGGVGGALEFAARLRGTPAEGAAVAETNGLIHIASIFQTGRVTVKGVKRNLPVGLFPAAAAGHARARLSEVFPDLVPAENVLVTSLSNTNTIVHPPISILSAGLIETRRGDFPFFTQALSPGAGRLIDAVDRERVRLVEALQLPTVDGVALFMRFYGDQGMRGKTIQEMLSTFGPFQRSLSPDTLKHSYFTEDVPFGFVPLASLSRQFAEPAVAMEAVITLSSIVCGQDFWATGRTVESLGLAGCSRADLLRLVEQGWQSLSA